MGGLLEENGIGTKDLTCIYGNLLRLLSVMATRELEDDELPISGQKRWRS